MPEATNPGPDRWRLLVVAAALGVAGLLAAPPIAWLPPAGDTALLSTLLGAQAAITALTLAVAVFVLQVVGARRDADDRVYEEYVVRSRVNYIFPSSVIAVGVTGAVLIAEEFISGGAPVLDATPGLRNLTLLAVPAFTTSLMLAVTLYVGSIRLAAPDEWRRLRRDVREAVRRWIARQEAVEPDYPGSYETGEGSADAVVRALLDDARRAMDERAGAAFRQALDSIEKLLESAMDELEHCGFGWSTPGSDPFWTPLAELDGSLFEFREDVIRGGGREHVRALHAFDYRLLSIGVTRRCGELFTVGLDGYRANFELAARLQKYELRKLFHRRASTVAKVALGGLSAEDNVPYMKEIIRHQEQLLSRALHTGRNVDFESFVTEFADAFKNVKLQWAYGIQPGPDAAGVQELERTFRISIMGLAGRAILLHESRGNPDPELYVEVARTQYSSLEQLASDAGEALRSGDQNPLTSLWWDWEMEGAGSTEFPAVNWERYPLAFFTVRLLELAREGLARKPVPDLNFRGKAQQIRSWFDTKSDRLERYARNGSGADMEERRILALRALDDAVRRDELAAREPAR